MNRKIKVALEQLKALKDFKKKHEEVLKLNVLTWEMFEDAEAYLTRIETLLVEEDKNEKVATQEKNEVFEELETEGCTIFEFLSSYGHYKNFIPFKNIVGCNKWEIRKAADAEVVVNLQTMNSVMNDYEAQVSGAGISPERKSKFEALLLKADDILNEPIKYRQQQTIIIEKQEEEVDSFKGLINNALKFNMNANFAEDNPDLLREFMDCIRVDSPKSRKKVLMGRMTNQKGEAVRNVMISIDGEKPVQRGGIKGNFFFYNVSPGKHSIEFVKESYITIKKEFVLEADKVIHLDVVFELVKKQEDEED